MPFDEGTGGRLTPRARRARKRAGVRKPTAKFTPRADTGADKAVIAAKAKADPSARIDRPAEKARVAVQGRARTAFEAVEAGGGPSAKQKLLAITQSLTEAEKRDLGGYSGAVSRRNQESRFRDLNVRAARGADDLVALSGYRPSEAIWSAAHPIERLTDSTRRGQRQVTEGPYKGAYEAEHPEMGAFPGFGSLGRIPARVKNLADREALRALEKADNPLETIAKRYAKAAKAGDEEQMAVFKAAGEKIQAHEARVAAGKRPDAFGKKVVAQEKKAASAPITLHRGMGYDEYTKWAQKGTQVPAGTRFIKQAADDDYQVADLHSFSVRPDDVIEVSPGVFETVTELKLGGAGALRPVVAGHGPTTRGEKIITALNVPRAIKSSFDVSAPFRQGIVLGGASAKLWKESWVPMMKALRENTGEAERIEKEIRDNPLYELAKDRLALTDFKGPLTKQEENFIGLDYAKHIPGVEASSRAYNTFLNKLRMDFFEFYVKAAMEKGYDVAGASDESKYLLDSIGKWVNTASGRGGKVDAGKALAAANATFFSPRLIMSRLQLLNPAQYVPIPGYKGPHKFVRQQARKAMGKLAAEISATLVLAQQAGADVEWDPRSSDFGKIKLGDTRIDIAGGMAQFITLYARVLTRQTKTGAGEVVDLEGGYAGRDPWDVVTDFLENKAAPVPGYGVNYLKDESAPGVPFNPVTDTAKLFAPIGLENTIDAAMQGGVGPAAATIGLGSVGFGVDTYPTLSKAKPRTAEARMEASIKKLVAKELPLARRYGWKQVPPHIVQAITLKGRIDARVKALTKDQKKAKNARTTFEDGSRFGLTGRQRAAAVLTALRDYVPNFNYEGAKLDTQNLNDNALENYTNNLRDFYYGETLRDWHGKS